MKFWIQNGISNQCVPIDDQTLNNERHKNEIIFFSNESNLIKIEHSALCNALFALEKIPREIGLSMKNSY